MEIKQPSAATYPGFRHIHRTLLPGESVPRVPTLVEQLQAMGASAECETPQDYAAESEVDEEYDEEWPEMS